MAASTKKSSWLDVPPSSDFSLDNIPFGICSFPLDRRSKGDGVPSSPIRPTSSPPTGASVCPAPTCPTLPPSAPRCCTALGACAVDLSLLAEAGLLDDLAAPPSSDAGGNEAAVVDFHPRIDFSKPTLNDFMSRPKPIWIAVRNRLVSLFLAKSSSDDCVRDDRLEHNLPLRARALRPLSEARCHLPARIGDYTDFYSSREHATNVGVMFRGKDNALQPNWLRMPIGYHGRSSSVYPSGGGSAGSGGGDERTSAVRRPCGQLQLDPRDPKKGSRYGPCEKMDFELEVAFFVGGPSDRESNDCGRPLTVEEARDRIFGYVLMNDWSARDVQKWEYVPLGPFTSKNFATTVSTWVVTTTALEPHRCETSAGVQGGTTDGGGEEPIPLDYLRDPEYGSYDVNLSVSLRPEGSSESTRICRSNLKHLYWSSAQQLVHHSVTGCPMNPGDLLASGTISGEERGNFGSMLELSWSGTRDVELDDGEVRTFLEDGDAVIMEGWCEKEGMGRVGFGQCSGKVLPADPFPYASSKAARPQSKERYADFKLHGFWRSSCTWRVHTALAAKGVPHEIVPVNLFENDQSSDAHASRNPMRQVPVLEFVDRDRGGATVRISQSLAIVEFLEAAFADRGGRLLPEDPVSRAKVKEVAEIVNSGIQPLQNLSVTEAVENAAGGGGAGTEFGRRAIAKGLSSLEAILAPYHSEEEGGARRDGGGPYALGSHGPTLADVCLVPQMYNARRFDVDCASYPTLLKVEEACKAHPWFRNVPELQQDYGWL